ncbi:MAG: type II secretion system major pseudopilin GspG [Verrucomicrobiota bacterium]
MKSPSQRRAGYTLLEIMLVLGIIAILVSSGIYLLSGNIDVAKETRVDGDLKTISTQLKTYEMSNYALPTTEQGIAALVEPPSAPPEPRRWKKLLEELPTDPWGHPYQYRCPGAKNPTSFDIFSLGPDGIESADDLGNWK